jgi:hypothetical protein
MATFIAQIAAEEENEQPQRGSVLDRITVPRDRMRSQGNSTCPIAFLGVAPFAAADRNHWIWELPCPPGPHHRWERGSATMMKGRG